MGSLCDYISCEDIDMLTGKCKLTACNKVLRQVHIVPDYEVRDAIIFPQTIGDITFYSSKELVKWVEDQQKMNKDPDYGRGNWA